MGKDSRDLPGQALLDAAWFDPIEVMIRDRVRGFIENLVEAELDDALGRSRYQRPGTANVASGTAGYRHGRRARQLLGSFGAVTIQVPRARLNDGHGTSREWRSEALPRYGRMTRQVEALIAGTYFQYASGAAGVGGTVQGCGWQRCCQPDLAKGADGLAGMVSSFVG